MTFNEMLKLTVVVILTSIVASLLCKSIGNIAFTIANT